jgi:predicted SprT family Zn-dependent metalloprotease
VSSQKMLDQPFVWSLPSLARTLLDQYGLTDWTFKFDRARKRAGRCCWAKKTISLSRYFCLMNTEEEIWDTLLHELAHAMAGWKAGHGSLWKCWCRKLGCKPERCYDSSKVKMPAGKYRGKCSSCQRSYSYHRKPKYTQQYCSRCGPISGLFTIEKTENA